LWTDEAPVRGTRVVLHLNETSKDYLETGQIERIVREHSSALTVPIELVEEKGRRIAQDIRWRGRSGPTGKLPSRNMIIKSFIKTLGGMFDDPGINNSLHVEGRQEYTVLAFVPGSQPFDLFDPARPGRAKLYVRHVLITDDAEVLPRWLRFVPSRRRFGLDLPLNVSRETIQQSPVFHGAIKKAVTNRVLQELVNLPKATRINSRKFGSISAPF